MKCAVPREWELQKHEAGTAATGLSASRRLLVLLAALAAALLWALIIGAICWATGMWMGTGWFAALIASIFILALVGLSVAASGTERSMSRRTDDT